MTAVKDFSTLLMVSNARTRFVVAMESCGKYYSFHISKTATIYCINYNTLYTRCM
jgi:hypothetical protein